MASFEPTASSPFICRVQGKVCYFRYQTGKWRCPEEPEMVQLLESVPEPDTEDLEEAGIGTHIGESRVHVHWVIHWLGGEIVSEPPIPSKAGVVY